MTPILEIQSLAKRFPVKGGGLLHAVDDVSFAINAGESLGLVGESGCGKSTLVRLVARLLDSTAGRTLFEGVDIGEVPAKRFARDPRRAAIQMVFQDPTDSLNPRFTSFDTIAEPLKRLRGASGDALKVRVAQLATQVGLPPELLSRFPHQLSGGQKARVGIARAIALDPKLLVLDEPTAALDVSVQATVLNLLGDLRTRLGMSYIFVTHDLNIVRLMCERVVVMYLGKVVESGPVQQVFDRPLHPYTKALVASIPDMERRAKGERLAGEPRSPINPDANSCRFCGRCPKQTDRCRTDVPVLRELAPAREVACHFPVE
ncbi:MAG: ABC transporter ATP-binding protein [Burkholderiales bacterium]